MLEEPHEGCLGRFSRLAVRRSHILHSGIYRAMPERLFDERKIDVAIHKMRSEAVLQGVWVPFLNRQSSYTGSGLENSEKLRSVEFPALLARK